MLSLGDTTEAVDRGSSVGVWTSCNWLFCLTCYQEHRETREDHGRLQPRPPLALVPRDAELAECDECGRKVLVVAELAEGQYIVRALIRRGIYASLHYKDNGSAMVVVPLGEVDRWISASCLNRPGNYRIAIHTPRGTQTRRVPTQKQTVESIVRYVLQANPSNERNQMAVRRLKQRTAR